MWNKSQTKILSFNPKQVNKIKVVIYQINLLKNQVIVDSNSNNNNKHINKYK